MKIIKMFGGKEFLIENDTAQKIAESYNSNSLVDMGNGEFLNPRGIESIADPDIISVLVTFSGEEFILNKDGVSFQKDNKRVCLSPQQFKDIEHQPHPKYNVLKNKLIKQLK